MPPRHAYWTIILEGKPTAFRAHTREELEPTLRQLRARHPDAVMLWFARGRLWESPEQQRAAVSRREHGETRGSGWRPGGAHRDPRERFQIPRDEKRRRFAERSRRDRFEPQEPGQRDSGACQRPARQPFRPRGPQSREGQRPLGERPARPARDHRGGESRGPQRDNARRPDRPDRGQGQRGPRGPAGQGGRGWRRPGGGGRRGGGGGGR